MREQSDDRKGNDSKPEPERQGREGQPADDTAALLSAFSHDFATPLANIKLAAEVLISAEGRVPADRLAELGHNVSSEADRLRRMIDTLIEWSRLDRGERALRQEWHLVEDLIGSALRRTQPLLDDQKVVVTIEPDMAFVRGDEVLLETVLMHLIDNAANFTPAGESIEIRARADQQGCTVEVADAGPQLEDAEDVSVDARCSARSGQTGAPGAGLGLVVSRMIIEAHGGEVRIRNRTGESGAVFAFVLGYGGESPPHAPIEAS